MFAATKVGTIDQIYLNHDLNVLAEKIFDSVVFRSDANVLLETETFKDAEKLNNSSKINFFHYGSRIAKRLKLKMLDGVINSIYKSVVLSTYSKKLYKISSLDDSKYVTLFDISQLDRPNNREFYNIINSRQNFSILHGTGIAGIRSTIEKRTKKIDVSNTTAYIFSEKEIPYYEGTFGLTRKQMKIYGIPKHQKEWIKELSSKESTSESGHIFIISRPTNERLTIDRRKKFLEMIKDETITEGMIPKINTCLDAVNNGVTAVGIIDGRKKHSILFELLSDKGSGTLIRQ